MSEWLPHVTVATVVPDQSGNRFLFVEETDETGSTVINQPAGHLEKNETLVEAAIRETLEETRWHVEITGFSGIALYNAANGITYQRNTFIAAPIKEDLTAELDDGIIRPLWLSLDELNKRHAQWRSHLVGLTLQHFLSGHNYPLSVIYA